MENDLIVPMLFVVALLVMGALAFVAYQSRQRRRSESLREHFGPEYERALAQHGDRGRAERELLQRQKRRDALDIRLLSREQCVRFGARWAEVQQRFVDEPSGAVNEADGLVTEVMRSRGYPMADFEQRVADLSVEHANVIDHYRAARALVMADENGQAGTEDLRQAMVHYRALFNDLLRSEQAERADDARPSVINSPRMHGA
jgi:hypothetical protein